MNNKELCCSLESAMKLKELGTPQQSVFCWFTMYNSDGYELDYNTHEELLPSEYISAYTASELIAMLPHRITLKENEPFNSFVLVIKKSLICDRVKIVNGIITTQYLYVVNYECDSTETTGADAWLTRKLFEHNICDTNFAEALAKTLIQVNGKYET